MKRALKFLSIITFIILLYNRILIYIFDSSIAGYFFERFIFFTFLISSIILLKKYERKKYMYLAIAFVLITNFTRAFWTGLMYTNYERKIDEKLYLTESTTIESSPAFHIMERSLLTEKNLTLLNSNLKYDDEFRNLKKIRNIELLKKDDLVIILKYENENKIKIDTFQRKKYN
jgi:hypothetical protein